MKTLFSFFLLFLSCNAGVIAPPGFPYPLNPFPTNGSTPGTTTRVPGTINRTGYSDNPSMWVQFIGGAPRPVATTNEMLTINPKARLEGQMAWVKDSGIDSQTSSLYMLVGGVDNTNWIKLANITTTNGFNYPSMQSVNIYNTSGVLTTNRVLSGAGLYSLTLSALSSFNQTSDNLNLLSTEGNVVGLHNLLLASSSNILLNAPSIYMASSNVLHTNDVTGWVWTALDSSGLGEWKPGGGGGQNIMNSDLTADGSHVQDGNGNDMTFNNFVNWTFDVNGFTVSSYGFSIDGDIGGAFTSGPSTIFLSKTNGIWIDTGGPINGLTNQFRIATSNFFNYALKPGYVLTVVDTNNIIGPGGNTGALVEFLPSSGSGGVSTNIGNSDLTITDPVRTLDGGGNDLHLQNMGVFQAAAGIVGLFGSSINLEGSSFVNINQSGDVTNLFSFENPSLPGATNDYVLVRNAAGGYVRKSSYTIGDLLSIGAGGQNFANTDLTFTGSRTHDAAGNSLVINNLNGFALNNTGGIDISGNGLNLLPANYAYINSSSGVGIYFDNSVLSLVTPNAYSGTVVPGQIPTAIDNGGTIEFADPPAGQNIANSDLTSNGNHVLDVDGNTLSITNFTTTSISASPSTQVIVKNSSVELKATGSNPINLHSDSIAQSTATVGQVWTLQNATTGAGEWADGTAPSGGNVKTVETIADLLAENTAVVITQGYYSVGDGGHAAYRYVFGDTTATNTVTVFEGSSGRYFLMQSGSISAKQAGAVGDGSADDGPFLQAGLNASVNLTFRIDPLAYRSTAGLIIPDHVKVIARGATITVETTGSDRAVDMGSWCEWVGGTVIDAYQSGGDGSSNDHCPFRFGDYLGVANAGVSNSIVRECTMDVTGDYPAVSVLVTQNSNNILIAENEVPASSTLDDAFVVHWGYVTGGDETAGTRHPHNIVIRNNHVGVLSTTTRDGGAVSVSAAYDVDVDTLKSDQCRYPIYSTTGDFGFKYSGLTVQTLGSVSLRNSTCLAVRNAGAYITSVDNDAVQHTLNHVIDNCTLIGFNDGGGQAGLFMSNVRNLTVRNSVLAGHEYGTVFTNGCQNILFDTVLFATNRLAGFMGSDPNTKNVTVRSCRFQNNSSGVSGTNAAAIRLLAGENFRILDNDIGNPVTEANQEVGIECIPSSVNMTITGNRVLNVKSGGVDEGYYLGNSVDTGHLWLVSGNTANATTLMVGPDQIPYTTRAKYRVFTGTATPTVGTYLKGDMVVFNEATSTPFAKICSVAGSPGTWVTAY